jgi:tetratricopeptide (TPR) repeat protein
LLLGNLLEAKRIVKRALELAEANEERGIAADILELLGEIAAAERPTASDAADEFFRRAKGLATELGMRPLIAHCHLGLGKLYRRMSKGQEARQHLTTATTMYGEMGMTYWLEQAEAK